VVSTLDHHHTMAALLAGQKIPDAVAVEEFSAWASVHGIAPVAHELAPEGSRLRLALRPARIAELANHLDRGRRHAPLLERLHAAGVSTCFFKGCGLAHHAAVYATPELRPLGDLDLIVPPDEVSRAVAAATDAGFRPLSDDPETIEFHRRHNYQVPMLDAAGNLLEIHHELYRDFPAGVLAAMLERSRPLRVYGTDGRILSDVDLWLVCAVHLGQNRALKWIWLVDLWRLSAILDADGWTRLEQLSLATGTQLFVVAAAEALRTLWGPVPALPPDPIARLARRLRLLERRAVAHTRAQARSGRFDGDPLIAARRLSGRPVRGGLFTRPPWLHPGSPRAVAVAEPERPAPAGRIGVALGRARRALAATWALAAATPTAD
jgi:hypothetical protein